MTKKKIAVLSFAVLLLCAWGFRVWSFNDGFKDKLPKVVYHNVGEPFPIGNNYFDRAAEQLDGYVVTLLESKLVTGEECMKSYGLKNDYLYNYKGTKIEYFYIVKIRIRNESNPYGEEKGFDFNQFQLQGTDFSIMPDDYIFGFANPKLHTLSASVRLGTEYDFVLPYPVLQQYKIDTKTADPCVVASLYPTKNLLRIK